VWAFGILAWELYTAFATGQERKGYSVPYCDLVIDEVGNNVTREGHKMSESDFGLRRIYRLGTVIAWIEK